MGGFGQEMPKVLKDTYQPTMCNLRLLLQKTMVNFCSSNTTTTTTTDNNNNHHHYALKGGEAFTAVAPYEETPPVAPAPPSSLPESLAPAGGPQQLYCRALYDYESTCEDELSFCEGDIIKIVSKLGSDGVDDGWWTGEFNGLVSFDI